MCGEVVENVEVRGVEGDGHCLRLLSTSQVIEQSGYSLDLPVRRQITADALDLLDDADRAAATSDRQCGVRGAGGLLELSVRDARHREPTQCSRATSLVDHRQCAKRFLVQRDRLLRLTGRQPAVR